MTIEIFGPYEIRGDDQDHKFYRKVGAKRWRRGVPLEKHRYVSMAPDDEVDFIPDNNGRWQRPTIRGFRGREIEIKDIVVGYEIWVSESRIDKLKLFYSDGVFVPTGMSRSLYKARDFANRDPRGWLDDIMSSTLANYNFDPANVHRILDGVSNVNLRSMMRRTGIADGMETGESLYSCCQRLAASLAKIQEENSVKGKR